MLIIDEIPIQNNLFTFPFFAISLDIIVFPKEVLTICYGDSLNEFLHGDQHHCVTNYKVLMALNNCCVMTHNVTGCVSVLQLLTVALVVLVAGVIADYTDEELAALEELKEAGLLDDVAIDQLIEEYEAAYMGEEYDYDLEEDYGILDEASDRGGPRRRRKPGVGTRRFQRPTLFQMIQKRFFLPCLKILLN